MAREVIDVGTIANDGTGDTLRACWIKVNNMTDEIYTTFGDGSSLNASVLSTGTPANNQLAIWTDSSTVEGDSNLTWDGSTLGITGDITVSGTVDGRDIANDGTKLDGIETGAEVNTVDKVGTPADNQIGVWTGDGTIEGDSNLTWDGADLSVTGTINADNYGDGTDSVPASAVLKGTAKAYANVDAASVLSQGENISSITDAATGEDDIAFTNNMSNGLYGIAGAAEDENNTRSFMFRDKTVSGFTSRVRNSANNLDDTVYNATVFGDLA